MGSRFTCCRLFAVLVLISVILLPRHVAALEEQTQGSLSLLPMVYGECPWGHTPAQGRCIPVRVPAHAFLDVTGKYWECERGYKRVDEQCIPVKVPPHAFLDYSGHDWECERGYERAGNQCVRVKVPAHAYLDYFGHDWVCERGYKRLDDQCVPIKLPAHAHLDYTGNDWECKRGYERVNDTCRAMWARLGTPEARTLAMALSPETPKTIRQLQYLLKQAGYDPGPIDGILGPKTLTALQQYLKDQERTLAQATSAGSHKTNGT